MWFTVEKIDEKTFAISEYGHYEKVHSFLLIGEKKAALIDTGLGIGNIKEITDSITNLPIEVITTHAHWDHIGGHKYFENIYVHEKDYEWLRDGIPIPLNVIKSFVIKEPILKHFPKDFTIDNYTLFKSEKLNSIKDGHEFDLGGRLLKVLHTPGHSPGHICIFDKTMGYLFTGDLIYKGTLFAFYPSTNPEEFALSVQRLSKIKGIKKILPSHNDLKVEVNLIDKVDEAFNELKTKKLLKQGSGIFDFGDFKIHI